MRSDRTATPSSPPIVASGDAFDVEISDDELTVLALAADADALPDADAVPFRSATSSAELLPEWYMPAPTANRGGRTRRLVIAGLISALLLVNGAGLCVTYGFPEIAW